MKMRRRTILGAALAAPYPFATKDPNIGVAKVPDDRLDRLAVMSKTKTLVHAAVQVVDIGGVDFFVEGTLVLTASGRPEVAARP